MLLIGQFDSPFVRRVAVALHHYGIGYEHRPWSVWADADQIARYNPLRRVPILVLDTGEALVESHAILDTLDELASPGRCLIAPGGVRRRATLRVCAMATGLADKAVSLLYERVLRKDGVRSAVWIERCTEQIEHTLDLLERERGARGGEFWFGDLTHADVAVACALRFLGEAHPAIWGRRERPALASLSRRCEGMVAFQSAAQPLHVAV